MGTNYYLRHGICACCGRYDELHICKSFRTWHAPVEWPDEPPYEPVVRIATWEGWKRRLRDECASGGRIFDEYGRERPLHEFIEHGDRSGADPEQRPGYRNAEIKPRGEWYDADGYWFYAGEFS